MSKTRKVLLIIQDDGYPADTRARNEVKTLVSAGYQVSVISPSFGIGRLAEDSGGANIYRFPSWRRSKGYLGYALEYSYSIAAIYILSLLVWIRRGFDVLHVHNPPDILFLVGLFYKPFGKKFVYDHNDLAPEIFQARFNRNSGPMLRLLLFLEKLSCKVADVIVTVNQSSQELETTRNGVSISKTFIVRNGPDLPRLKSLHLNGHDKVTPGTVVLGYIGHLNPQDGVDSLLGPLHHLAYGLGRQDFRCVVIGDGTELEGLKATSREMKLDSFISFLGRLPWEEAMKRLSATDICVDPSPSSPINDKTTTIKIMEYMALGKPIVAFDLFEHRRSAQDAALYARPNDPKDFAAKLAQLMDNEELRKSMALAGKGRIEKDLSWEGSVGTLLAAYESLFSHR